MWLYQESFQHERCERIRTGDHAAAQLKSERKVQASQGENYLFKGGIMM